MPDKLGKTDKTGDVQIEVKLNTSMDSILRYQAALKRDLYRAIRTLREIQQQRREWREGAAMSTEPSRFIRTKAKTKSRSETHANRGETDRPSKFDEFTDRHLRQAIENKDVGLDGLQAARVMLVKLFGRIERMHQKIDAAFCGQPFLQELSPTCPANVRRFNTYFREHQKV